jgi:hypothetical protein
MHIETQNACLYRNGPDGEISKQEQKGKCEEPAKLDKLLEADGSCVNEAWGTILNKEECEAVNKACSENPEACD